MKIGHGKFSYRRGKILNILALDTSSTSGSVAICKDNKISFISYLDIQITHSERLMPQIDFGLKQAKLTINDIDLISISNGPGSFTGIRIGLATAKGFCMGKEIPLFPVNTLKLLAYNIYGCKWSILPFIDAKMDEVYAALYSSDLEEKIHPQNAKPDVFLKMIKEPVFFVGDGAIKYKEKINKSGIQYEIALSHQNIPLASTLISIALKMNNIPKFDFDFIAELEPYYLRQSQAEIIKKQKETGNINV